MRLFWKIYLSLFIPFLVIVSLLSYTVYLTEVREAKRRMIEENRFLAGLITHEAEAGSFGSRSSPENLKKALEQKGVLFWQMGRYDGAGYPANDTSYTETNVRNYLQAQDGAKEKIFFDESGESAVYLKFIDVGRRKVPVWIGFSMKEISKKKQGILLMTCIASGVALAILGIMLYFLLMHFAKPIRDLVEGADKVAKGDLTHRIPVFRKDDMGFLARSFNAMTEELQKATMARDTFNEEREKFISLTDQAPFGMALIGEDGTFRYVNPKFREIFGYGLKEIPTEEAWFKRVFPDETYRHDTVRSWFEAFNSGPFGEREPRILTVTSKDETSKIVRTIPVVLDTGEYLITCEDITEKKKAEEAQRRAEEKYRKMFEGALEGIFQADLDGRLITANPAFARLLGYDSQEELGDAGIDIWTRFYPEPSKREEFTRRMFKEGDVRDEEIQAIRRDREPVWLSMNARIVKDERGDPLYYEGAVEDINGRKGLEAELLQAQKMEAIGALAGGIAHDFNNLLTGVQGYATLMLLGKDQSDPDYKRLRGIEEQVQSGATLTKQLLEFAQKGRHDIKPTDLNEIITKTSAMFGRTRKEITIETKLQEKPWIVEADQGQIEQMLINLYLNAWQAMPGGGRIMLETANIALTESFVKPFSGKAGNFVRITVADTGIGMDEKTRQRIFEPFFTTKEMGRGTGLGLASVYGIVKGHGGIITVSSKEGEGTVFNIYLPVTAKEIMKEKTPDEEIMKGKETVLLVDDEDMIIDVSRQLLEALGYNVFAARNGQDAVNLYRQYSERIDVVILDMIMPEMGSRDVFDALRAINPHVKIILSSGYNMNGLATNIMERGCRAFIQKPFSIDQLSKKLRKVLDS